MDCFAARDVFSAASSSACSVFWQGVMGSKPAGSKVVMACLMPSDLACGLAVVHVDAVETDVDAGMLRQE
jgi:hypothetical protein